METVELPKEDAIKLLADKLRALDDRIESILQKWNQSSTEEFLEKARKGLLEDTEMDAIILTNLLEERERISNLYDQIG